MVTSRGSDQLQRFFLHQPAGHRAYVVIVDSQRRPFDFTDDTFKPASDLGSVRNACLFATGRPEERADHGYSYSVEFDLARLLAGSKTDTVPVEDSVVEVHWLVQVGEEPNVRVDRQCDSCRLRVVAGMCEPIAPSSMLDEKIAFEKRERFEREYRDFVLRDMESQEERRHRLAACVSAGDVGGTLHVLAEDLYFWGGNLKQHLLHQVSHLAKDPFFVRMRDVAEDAAFQVLETWIVRDWIGAREAFDLLEFHKSPEYAQSFSARLDRLHEERLRFAKILTETTVRTRGEDVEAIFALDEMRKDLKHKALWLAEHVSRIATQFDSQQPPPSNQSQTSSSDSGLPEQFSGGELESSDITDTDAVGDVRNDDVRDVEWQAAQELVTEPDERSPWFDCEPDSDSKYKFGPLAGSLKQITKWMDGPSQPTLRSNNGKSYWYIRKLMGRHFSVWLDSQRKFAEANQRHLADEQNESKTNETK